MERRQLLQLAEDTSIATRSEVGIYTFDDDSLELFVQRVLFLVMTGLYPKECL